MDEKTEALLKEPADRKGKFLLLGTRRAGGNMAPVTFRDTLGEAESAALALQDTGWHAIEVYTRVAPETP